MSNRKLKSRLTGMIPVLQSAWEPSGTDGMTPNQILPHTVEAGDPYYIGDAYEKSRVPAWISSHSSKGSPNVSADEKAPYLAYLDFLKRGWPHVSYLADFMRVTTSPPKLRFLNADDKAERASRTRVSVVKFLDDGTTDRVDTRDVEDLAEVLDQTDIEQLNARLIIVEDLSTDVIECLGARYDIDPLFFRSHISDYTWHNTRDPWVELRDLDIVARKRSHFCVPYVQTRYFRSEKSLTNARRQAGGFNVLRRVDRDGNWVLGADIPRSDVGLVRSKTSFWTRQIKKGESGVLGILLVDPTIREGYPLWGGYRNFNDCPSIYDMPQSDLPPRKSNFDDMIYWTRRLRPTEINELPQDPRILFKQPLMIICAEWYTLFKYATTRLTQIEWEVENPDLQNHQAGLSITIRKLHSWRRRLPIFRTLILEVLEKVIKRDTFPSSSSPTQPSLTTTNSLLPLQRDFEILYDTITQLQLRADRVMAVVTAVMSIEESKKAVEQNRSLARLTWLAVTFVPLTFVTGLFSMQADLSALGRTFWIYFAAAVPLTALALVVTRYGARFGGMVATW